MSETDKSGNMLKYENYREQFKRLKRALDAQFYLEAIFIEYSILEDRTESILKHAGKWDAYLKKRGRYPVTIESKISYIQNFAREKKSLLHKYFGDGLLDEVLAWKNERNTLMHALLKQKLTTEYLAEIASRGKELADRLKNRSSNFSKAVNRKAQKK